MDDEIVYIPTHVPVFPLPQVVLFPGTLLPLHIFEPRYREMTADALASEQMIATALLKPGFEPLYYTRRAPIHPTINVARIVGHQRLSEGNYNILLRGLARARIVAESDERPYRLAQIEPVQTFCSSGETRSDELREELEGAIRKGKSLEAELRERWLRLFDVPLQLDELSDLIAAGLPTDPELRQFLLDEPDAAARAELLAEQIRTLAAVTENVRRLNASGGLN